MNHNSRPSDSDYTRLRRALLGSMLILLAFIIAGFGIEFAQSDAVVVDGLFCVLYCSFPIVAIFAIFHAPVTPQNDPTFERYVKGSTNGRRFCFWFGVGCLCIGILVFLPIGHEFNLAFIWLTVVWFVVSGLSFVCWSFQFPTVRIRVRSDIERDAQKDDSQTTHETTNQEPEWLRRLRRAITAVIVIGSVMWVALFLGVSFNWPNTDRPFNAEQWRTADARQRGRFVRDLLWSDVLMDQPQDRVIELLGPPDHADNVEILYKVDYGYWFFPWRSKVTIGLDGEPAKVVSVLTIR